MRQLFQTLALTIFLVPTASFAQDFDTGIEAYNNKDYKTALRELRPLAEQGNAEAQYKIGYIFFYGWGVSKDSSEGLRWFRLAAEQGHANSLHNMGVYYNTGRGVPVDKAEALRFWRAAATKGQSSSQFNLGSAYEQGDLVLQDLVTAHMWFNISSANGDTAAGNRRDDIGKQLSPDLVNKAVERAKICMSSDYRNCN